MRHRPHLLIEDPWAAAELAVSTEAQRHINRVLRTEVGATVTYTNGVGTVGSGSWTGSGVVRGDESSVQPQIPSITLAVAAPRTKDRQRFIVEKAQELGVHRLVWLKTDYGEGRPVAEAKMLTWAKGALEQSRGAWLMGIGRGYTLSDLDKPVLLDVDAPDSLSSMKTGVAVTLAIGPEGGFSPDEIEASPVRARLHRGILRTDTAAIVAAASVLAE